MCRYDDASTIEAYVESDELSFTIDLWPANYHDRTFGEPLETPNRGWVLFANVSVQSNALVNYGMDAVAGIEDRRFATADDAARGFAQLAADLATLANSREPLASAWR